MKCKSRYLQLPSVTKTIPYKSMLLCITVIPADHKAQCYICYPLTDKYEDKLVRKML